MAVWLMCPFASGLIIPKQSLRYHRMRILVHGAQNRHDLALLTIFEVLILFGFIKYNVSRTASKVYFRV